MKRFLLIFTAAVFLIVTALIVIFPLPGQVPVLMYHFVGDERMARESKNFVSRKTLEKQMAFLKFFRYKIITLEELYANLNGTRKPEGREIAITFDDGHISFLTEAYPVLNKYRFPVTMFLISDQVQGKEIDRLSISMVKSLMRNGWIDFESHTRTHPLLSKLSDAEIRNEIAGSKEDLERIFGKPMDFLAYPVGDIDERVLAEAEKAGYKLAFTTSYKKLKNLPEGRYSVYRQKISDSSDNPVLFWVRISGIYQAVKRFRHFSLQPALNA